MNVQWYPGHMARANRLIVDSLKLVDAVCEIIDARIPFSSRNPDLNKLALRKPRIIIINRTDLADPEKTEIWVDYFKSHGHAVVKTNSKDGCGIQEFYPAVRALLSDKIEKYESRGMGGRCLKLMIVGVPNVGKSSFINRIIKKKSAAAFDKPGVTRKNQWFTIADGIDLLDTPGVLPPKFSSMRMGLLLACTGAVREDILDVSELACAFLYELSIIAPGSISQRYGFDIPPFSPAPDDIATANPEIAYGYEILKKIAAARGFLNRGGEEDFERAAHVLLDEFRSGKLGRITLENPDTY